MSGERAEAYRVRAAWCWSLVDVLRDEQARESMRHVAQSYDKLARLEDAMAAPGVGLMRAARGCGAVADPVA